MKISLKRIDLWKILYLYLIFQPTLSDSVKVPVLSTIIQYSDEVIAVALLLIVLAKYKFEVHLLPFERKMLFFLFVFEFIGIVSGLYYQYQSIRYMFVDAFTCVKFLVFYYCARTLTKGKLTDKFFFSLNNICKMLAVVLFLLTIHELVFTPWWPKGDFRLFTNSIKLFFFHQEQLARACFAIMCVLGYNHRYYHNNIFYMLALSFVAFFTFRTKAIVTLFAFYIIYIYFIRIGFRNKLPIAIGGIAGAVYLGYDSFQNYYVNHEDAARRILQEDAINLANKYFPLGTGFGSFASSMSAQHYSKLYIKLLYYKNPDLGRKSEFLSDTFWPILFAQTGWIGTGAFCLGILNMAIYIIKSSKKDIFFFWIASSIFIYDIITSFAAPAFFHPSSMVCYLLLGLMVSIYEFPQRESV